MDIDTKLDSEKARAAYGAEIRKALHQGAEPAPAVAFDLDDIRGGMTDEAASAAAAAILRALEGPRS